MRRMDFGQLLLERGLISPKELDEALAEQRRLIVEGREPVPRLGEILVQRGSLTERQVAEALESQQKEILYCPRCNVQVNVELRADAAGYRCGTCQGSLEKPSDIRSVRVADTSVILVTREPVPAEVQLAVKDPARKFGKYILLEEVGRGGAAIVHRAWDTYLNQFVALKFLKPPRGSETDAQRRSRHESRIIDLLKEARSAIRLRHPNIVTIYDVGRIDRQFYIAMDCLEGRSLLALVRAARDQGKISPFFDEPRRFTAILRDVSRAAHYAHTRQSPVIHCDLKPSNIFIDTKWKPHVLDFGLARHLSEAQRDDELDGAVRGTPAYMAPEQAAGRAEDIDARTDVYGIGAILYELLTGRPPFSGEILDLLRKVLHEAPDRPSDVIRLAQTEPPAASDAALWSSLERICLKALEKEKGRRYQTARELAEEFDRLLRGGSGSHRAVTTRPQQVPAPLPPPATPETSGALVRGAVVVEGWIGTARRHWREAAGIATGALALLIVIVFLQRPLPKPVPFEESVRLKLEDLRRRVDVQAAALQLEQARRSYSEAASIVPAGTRRWLEDAQEDVERLTRMRDHLIAAINRPTRYAAPVFRLRDRELRDVKVLYATAELLVVFADDRALTVPWSVLEPETVARLAGSVLVGAGGANHEDRLGLGIYCAKNGLSEPARACFEALKGTPLDAVARRYLTRLDAKQR